MLRHPTFSLCVVGLLVASAIVLGLFVGPARATAYPTPSYHFDGTVANEDSATSIALLDLNGDGITDLAVGSPYNGSSQQGSVTFYLSSGGVPFKNVITVFGASGSKFGAALASVGNVAGLGPSLAVGAPLASPRGVTNAGNITLYYARPAFDGRASAWINSTKRNEELGFSLAGAGDMNADNLDDILAGAPFCNTGARGGGCAYVFYGGSPHPSLSPSLTFDSTQAGANFGFSVAGNGSVDGTNAPDIVVGAPNYPPLDTNTNRGAGAVYVIRNPLATNRTSIIQGVQAGDQFGTAVAMGDFNGDTIDDIAVGAPYNSNAFNQAGEVAIIDGRFPFKASPSFVLDGQGAGEWFGSALAAGNFHRDNFADLLVGAPGSTINATGVGRAYAYYGNPVPWTTANLTLVPGVSGANAYGSALAAGGNITRNGPPTYAVGDPQFLVGSKSAAGRAYVFLGDIVPVQNNPTLYGWVCVPFTFRGGTSPCKGLSGFAVTLESGTLFRSTTSGTNGSFTFPVVPRTYFVNTSKSLYIDNSTRFTLSFNQAKTLFIYPMTIPMVNGTAADAVNRTRYPTVTVALYNATNVLVNSTTTNVTGEFSMWVPPAFYPPANGPSSMHVSMWDGTHYTNTTPPLSVRRNQTAVVNMFINRFPVLNGTVYDRRTSARIGGATVQATQGTRVIATVTTNSQGEFDILAVNATQPALLFLNITCGGACGQYGRNQTSLLVKQNQTYTPSIALVTDRTPPSSNVWPLLTMYTTTRAFPVSANATDNNGVQQVQLWYQFNNTGAYVKYATDTAAPYTFSFNSSTARGDGRYGFYTVSVDYAGNIEAVPAANQTWTWVDTVRPTLTVTKPTAGQLLLHSWVNVTWTARDTGSGLLKVDVQLDSGAWAHAGLASFMNLTSVADGSHTVTVNATDRAGNSRSVSVAFSVNTAVPRVTFTSPANNSVTASSTVVLTWAIANPGTGLTLLQAALDTGTWQSLPTSSTSYSFTNLVDGSHNLWIHAETANAETTVYLRVTVDTTSPTASITSPTGNPWVNVSSEALAFSASDATSGLASLTISVDNKTAVDVTGRTSYTATGLADGAHQAVLTATDQAGNVATATAYFRVDATQPTVTFSAPADGASVSSSSVAVQWLVTDGGSGTSSVQISLDGGTPQAVTPGGTQTFAGLADGLHSVSIKATDAAGNVQTTSISFTVNTQLLGNNALAYGLIAAVVIIVVVIALVVWRMRKPKAPETPKQEPPPTQDEEKKT